MNITEKLDNIIAIQSDIKQCQAIMQNDIKHIVADNVEFKSGTNKNISTLKDDYYKTKEDVKQITFFGKILAGIYAGIIGILSIFYVK